MKNTTPVIIARITAFLIAGALGLLLFIVFLLNQDAMAWWLLILIPISTLIISYVGMYIALEKFLFRKIKLIYKIIYDSKLPEDKKPEKYDLTKDIIGDVENKVIDWQKKKSLESLKQEKLDQFRKEFLGNVFHELKTPIFNIQGYIETLIHGGLDDKKINVKFLKRAGKNVNRMAEVVDDLQMISNLEEGSFSVTAEKFDIHLLCAELVETSEMRASKKNIHLGFKEGCNTSFLVIADRELIHQVLSNLITNSIKYGKEDGLTQIGLYDMNEKILVEVSDNGIGIESKHLPRIFERFYRIDKNRSRELGGSGLGLSIVKHILEAHNQTINVRSTRGIGTTFGFTLQKAK